MRTIYLNNTRFARLPVVFFNRPTRVGTEYLIPLFRLLSAHNDINVVVNGPIQSVTRMRTFKEQLIETQWVSKLQRDTLYIAHGNWINFTKFYTRKPIYISLVRDPVERMIHNFYRRRTFKKLAVSRIIYAGNDQQPNSWYTQTFEECVRNGHPECQYIRYSVHDFVEDFKRQSLFFCGNHEDCLPFDTPRAVQMAKRNVEKEYAVVGTWDHPNITLTVLDKYIPQYFSYARNLYKLYKKSFSGLNRRYKVDPVVRAMVMRNFTHEYEFYNFCRQRLFRQYIALKLEHNIH